LDFEDSLRGRSMRIALFSDAYHARVSGQVASMDEFCTCLTERGHEVCIVCPSYPAERMKGVTDRLMTIRVPSGSALVSEDDRLAIPWREGEALRLLDEFKPQAVHVQTEFSIGAMGRRYCRKRSIPIMSTCHTFYEMYAKWYLPFLPNFTYHAIVRSWIRKVYAKDTLIVTPTHRIKKIMQDYGIEKEFAVIPTGVDERVFYPLSQKAQEFTQKLEAEHHGLSENLLLVYVGRISREKNLDMLAKAMLLILEKIPKVRLLMVGDGPKSEEIKEGFRRHGLTNAVLWLGLMQRENLPAVYSAADIFVFPSVTETQGLVTIEAMLCGAPVVGVNKMGTAEIMEGDKGGFLAEDNEADFALKVITLATDPKLRAEKSAQALQHARRWTIGHSCDEMEKLYFRVFGG